MLRLPLDGLVPVAASQMALGVGAMVEGALWTLMPPVDRGPAPVEMAIEVELDWLNAPMDGWKALSWAALGTFPPLIGTGLWRHSPRLLVVGTTAAATFGLLMQHVAGRRDPASHAQVPPPEVEETP